MDGSAKNWRVAQKITSHATAPHPKINEIALFGKFETEAGQEDNALWMFNTEKMTFNRIEAGSFKSGSMAAYHILFMGSVLVAIDFCCNDHEMVGVNPHADQVLQMKCEVWTLDLNTVESGWKLISSDQKVDLEELEAPAIDGFTSSIVIGDKRFLLLEKRRVLWHYNLDSCQWIKYRQPTEGLATTKYTALLGMGRFLLFQWGKDKKLQLFCWNPHHPLSHLSPVFLAMTAVDQQSKELFENCLHLDYFASSKDGLMFVTLEGDAFQILSMKMVGKVQSIKDIKVPGVGSDMTLVIGKDKAIASVHKELMSKSPWINR